MQLVKDNQWLADAPPATCINLGCFTLAPHTNLVIAGPDVGHNVGRAALLASGTIGAAIEGSLSGRKSIAVSFSYYRRFGSWTEAELAAAIEVVVWGCGSIISIEQQPTTSSSHSWRASFASSIGSNGQQKQVGGDHLWMAVHIHLVLSSTFTLILPPHHNNSGCRVDQHSSRLSTKRRHSTRHRPCCGVPSRPVCPVPQIVCPCATWEHVAHVET